MRERAKYAKEWRMKNREHYLDYRKLYYQKNKEKLKDVSRMRYKDNEGAYMLNYRTQIKIRVLAHYSNKPKPECVICGERGLPCLSIDHIEGCGTAERRRTGKGGYNFYLLLEKQGFPEGFQTLCMNCQFMKRENNNECHRDEKFVVKEEG